MAGIASGRSIAGFFIRACIAGSPSFGGRLVPARHHDETQRADVTVSEYPPMSEARERTDDRSIHHHVRAGGWRDSRRSARLASVLGRSSQEPVARSERG